MVSGEIRRTDRSQEEFQSTDEQNRIRKSLYTSNVSAWCHLGAIFQGHFKTLPCVFLIIYAESVGHLRRMSSTAILVKNGEHAEAAMSNMFTQCDIRELSLVIWQNVTLSVWSLIENSPLFI